VAAKFDFRAGQFGEYSVFGAGECMGGSSGAHFEAISRRCQAMIVSEATIVTVLVVRECTVAHRRQFTGSQIRTPN
jgi:16S rRNA G966 N2-methylase RsmD